MRIRPASESAMSSDVNTFDEPVRMNCPLRRFSSTIFLIAKAIAFERWASSMIKGLSPISAISARIWLSGSFSMALSRTWSSRVTKRAPERSEANISRTKVVLPACRGPMILTMRLAPNAASNSAFKCRGAKVSLVVMCESHVVA